MKIEYRSNNSGGKWWLKDKDWVNLEKDGWHVHWGGTYFCHSTLSFTKKPDAKPEPCESVEKCKGHRRYDSISEVKKDDEFLRYKATVAILECDIPGEAMRRFEKVTGQKVTDAGCGCCGEPHCFSWDGGYAAGDDCVQYLYPDRKVPKTIREAVEGGTWIPNA